MDTIQSKTFERILQYKVDFAYSKNLFYSALNRLKDEKKSYVKNKKRVDILILIFTLLSFSTAIYPNANTLILGVFAFLAFGLSVFQFINYREFTEIQNYKSTADKYLILYKECKNIITKAEDKIISTEELSKEIDKVQLLQNELIKNSPKTEEIDYINAKKLIESGNSEYTKEEIEKT